MVQGGGYYLNNQDRTSQQASAILDSTYREVEGKLGEYAGNTLNAIHLNDYEKKILKIKEEYQGVSGIDDVITWHNSQLENLRIKWLSH